MLVEPSSSKAALGYALGERVPAPWLNAHLHLLGAWTGYLRGPNIGNWTRSTHAALDPFDAGRLYALAADTATADTSVPIYRYAAIGEVGTAVALRVSRRGIGAGWVARSLPAGITSLDSIYTAGISFVGRWVLWGSSDEELWSTIADDASGDSAVGTDDNTKWTAIPQPTGRRTVAAAWCAGATGRAANARHAVIAGEVSNAAAQLLVSTDGGATWVSHTHTWSGSAYTADVAYDATRDVFVVVSGRAAVAVSPSGAPTGTWVQHAGPGILSGGDPIRIRCGGGTWIMVDPVGTGIGTPVAYRSRDAGASWTSLTAALPREPGTATPVVMYDLAYADGVWVMAVAGAPYLYASHDDGDSWERVALPIGEESAWDVFRVIYADGQVLASGLGFCVASGRAMGTADGTLVPDTTPSILSDAYRLRGRLIYDVPPNDGDVYSWNAATSRWEPVAASSLSVTTTRGDIIRRGASADERLAIGAAARYLRSDGTDPSWQQIAAADITGLPWWAVVPPDEVATSDATVTTLATISAATDHLYTVDVLVSAREAARTFSVAWKLLATVSSDGAAATVEDVLITGPTDGGASGCSVTIDASGTDIRVRVTGLGGTSITWGVQGTVQRIGS